MNGRDGFTHEVYGGEGYAAALAAACEALPPGSVAAVDLETTGLEPPPATLTWGGKRRTLAHIVCMSVTVHPADAALPAWTGVVTYPDAEVLRAAMAVLGRSGARLVAHNALFEHEWLSAVTGEVPPITDDALEVARLALPGRPHGLKPLTAAGYGDDYGIDVSPRALHAALQADPERVWEYCALDTWYTCRIFRDLYPVMDDHARRTYEEVKRPAQAVLARLNAAPALWADAERAAEAVAHFEGVAADAAARVAAEAPAKTDGTPWNVNSSPQLKTLFYERLGLPEQRTRDGRPTTDRGALAVLAAMSPVAAAVQEQRAALKMATMARTYLGHARAGDGRVPAVYGMGTTTGRLSCARENLQQIPRDQAVRGIFGAPAGRRLVVADFSQVELRLAAHIAGEQAMVEAYRGGADLHRVTAARIAGVDEAEVTREMRSQAKAANFGLLYGMGAASYREYAETSYGVEMSTAEAESTRARFFEAYPALVAWHGWTRATLAEHRQRDGSSWLRMPWGVVQAWGDYGRDTGRVERQAINSQVQGLGALVMLRTLVELDAVMRAGYADADAALVGTVHDSVLVECDADAAEELAETVREVMEDPDLVAGLIGGPLAVPLVADVDVQQHWAD